MQNYIVGMTVPYMPEDKQAVIRAQIGLFELRSLRRSKENELFTGPFNVEVRESVDVRGTARPNIKWIIGNEGMIEYKVDKKGNLLAFMPDDEWWHNRIYLMDSPHLNMVNLHTHLGIIAGMDANQHIAILRNHLKTKKTIYDVIPSKGPRFSARNEELANQEIDKRRRVFTTVKDGKIEIQKDKEITYKIVPREVLDYKPEIVELIQNGKRQRLQYGWTSAPEFMNDIKPKVIKDIEALGLNPTAVGSVSPRDIAESITKMSKADLRAMAETLRSALAAPDKEEPKEPPKVVSKPGRKKKAVAVEG